MPQRQSTKRVKTEAVQGEDSYAVLRRIDVGEAKSLFIKSRIKTVDLQTAVAAALKQYDDAAAVKEGDPAPDPADLAVWGATLRTRLSVALDVARAAPDDGSDMNESLDLLATHIIEWNWVDDNGQPLPLPSKVPAVMEMLTDLEVKTLSNALQGPDAATGKR